METGVARFQLTVYHLYGSTNFLLELVIVPIAHDYAQLFVEDALLAADFGQHVFVVANGLLCQRQRLSLLWQRPGDVLVAVVGQSRLERVRHVPQNGHVEGAEVRFGNEFVQLFVVRVQVVQHHLRGTSVCLRAKTIDTLL